MTPLSRTAANEGQLSFDDLFGNGPAERRAPRRLLDPAEVAAALVWLAGEASSGVTGAVLPVDGGLAL